MRKLPARTLLSFVALLVATVAAFLGILSLPWVKPHSGEPPRLEVIARGKGQLEAGVGVAPIDVPLGAPIAGFAHLSYRSDGSDPVTARALVLSSGDVKLAIVSAELLLMPDSLRAAVLARLAELRLSGLVLGVTHTHASPGGYYENLVFERAALGPYDPAMRDLVANAIAESVRRALASQGPAELSVARGRDVELISPRDGAERDGRLTVLRFDRPGGKPLAELTLFAAHPTTMGIHNRHISGDWPSQFFARSQHGVRLLLQGPVGDQSAWLPDSAGPRTAATYGAAVDRAVDSISFGKPDPAPTLTYAAADLVLPTPVPPMVPGLLRQAATNLASTLLPGQAHVSALRLGPATLLFVPAEVMSHAAARWREMAGAGAEVVSVTDGYLGYVDTDVPSEPPHKRPSYYGPALAPSLERALSMVVGALREADKPVTSPAGADGTGGGNGHPEELPGDEPPPTATTASP